MRATPQHPLERARLRQVEEFTYPDGTGRLFQAVAFPRLCYLMRIRAEGGRADHFWLVDGQIRVDLDQAAEALSQPPSLSREERELLDIIPREWTLPGDFEARLFAGLDRDQRTSRRSRLRLLNLKGFIEVEANRLRLRPNASWIPSDQNDGPDCRIT